MDKAWYLSKAIWGGIAVIVGGLAHAVSTYVTSGTIDAPTLIATVGQGLGIIGVRVAL